MSFPYARVRLQPAQGGEGGQGKLVLGALAVPPASRTHALLIHTDTLLPLLHFMRSPRRTVGRKQWRTVAMPTSSRASTLRSSSMMRTSRSRVRGPSELRAAHMHRLTLHTRTLRHFPFSTSKSSWCRQSFAVMLPEHGSLACPTGSLHFAH